MIKTPGATTGSNSNSDAPVLAKNNLKTLGELKLILKTGSSGVKENVIIFPGPVPSLVATKFGTTLPDQDDDNCVISSSISAGDETGRTELYAYLAQVGMHFNYIRIQTSNTALYESSLFIGEMPPNGIASPEEIVLSDYAVSNGGSGYEKVLKIADRTLLNSRNFFMYISSIPASTTVTISMGVDGLGDIVTMTQKA